jgi:hypothetical protein
MKVLLPKEFQIINIDGSLYLVYDNEIKEKAPEIKQEPLGFVVYCVKDRPWVFPMPGDDTRYIQGEIGSMQGRYGFVSWHFGSKTLRLVVFMFDDAQKAEAFTNYINTITCYRARQVIADTTVDFTPAVIEDPAPNAKVFFDSDMEILNS